MYINYLRYTLLFLSFCLVTATTWASEKHKPFALAYNASGDFEKKLAETKTALQANGFILAGEYSPYTNAYVIVVTNDELKKAGASHSRAGYIAAQRVALTNINDNIQVAYTNPFYMAKAYRIDSNLEVTSNKLKQALGFIEFYGAKDGLTEKKLGKYHYMFGMEYFDDPSELVSHKDNKQALDIIEKNLSANLSGASKVYRIDIPGTSQTLFGISLKGDDKKLKFRDEKFIMSQIDFQEIRSTPHLPYELLVHDNEVEALHARFRIAINFPDLSMMGDHSFMKIMSTPDAINKVLLAVAGGKEKKVPDEEEF